MDEEEKENSINSSSSEEENKTLSLLNKSKTIIESQGENYKNTNNNIYQEKIQIITSSKKKIISYKSLILVPDKVQYSKKINQITENGINHLNYYCNNQRLNTTNKKIYLKIIIVMGKYNI